MSNQEIRAKARVLYAKYFVAVFIIGMCGEGLSNILISVMDPYFESSMILFFVFLVQFLSIPLKIGAVGCIEPLWISEQVKFDRMFAFFVPARFGQCMQLAWFLIITGQLVSVFVSVLMLHVHIWSFDLLLIPLMAILIRLQMTSMLFATGRYSKALDALTASYQQMRGRERSFIGMAVIVFFPQVIATAIFQALEQNTGSLVWTALKVLFTIFYVPYAMLATQGWVLEQFNDSGQPQESENKRNRSSFLADIKKEVEPSSEKLGDR